MSKKKGLKPADKSATIVHLNDTVNHNLVHAEAHVKMAKQAGRNKASLDHNLKHAGKHLDEAADHAKRLQKNLKKEPRFKKALKDIAK